MILVTQGMSADVIHDVADVSVERKWVVLNKSQQ
jgi:hypothetical protein